MSSNFNFKCLQKRLGVCESGGLIEAVRLLLGQLSVLNPTQLDAVDTRVSNLLPKLEQTAAKLDSQDPEKDKKINELYEIILKATQESHLLPEVLQRMVALESLHQKGDYTNYITIVWMLKWGKVFD